MRIDLKHCSERYGLLSGSCVLMPRRSAYSINASSITAVTERRSADASFSAKASTDGSKRVVKGFFGIFAVWLELGRERVHMNCTCIAIAMYVQRLTEARERFSQPDQYQAVRSSDHG